LGGIVLVGLAAKDAGDLVQYPNEMTPVEAMDTAHAGATKQGVGIGLLAAGAVALSTGLLFYLTGAPKQPRVVADLSAGPGGAGLTVSGVLP
jgi:hypothetical protein